MPTVQHVHHRPRPDAPADKARRAAERRAQLQRRWDAAQRCEPLAHRRGDDRGFYSGRVA